MTTTPIRPDVPYSWGPESTAVGLDALVDEAGATPTPGARALAAALKTSEAIYGVAGQLADARRELQNEANAAHDRGQLRTVVMDGRETIPLLQPEKLAAAAKSAIDRVGPSVDASLATIATMRGAAQATVDAAFGKADGHAQEIRAHVKGLGAGNPKQAPAKRLEFLRQAVKAEDKATIAAVLDSPPFLSGVDPETVEQIRTLAAETWAPHAHRQTQQLDELKRRVGVAAMGFTARVVEAMRIGTNTPAASATAALDALAGSK